MLAVVALTIAGTSSIGWAWAYTSAKEGYSLTIPDDWESAPDLVAKANSVAGGRYDLAFAPRHRPAGAPYILLSAFPYPGGREPTEPEMRGTAEQMLTGVHHSIGSSPTTAPGVPDEEVKYEPEAHRYSFNVVVSPDGMTAATILSYAYFGRARCVFLTGYLTPAQTAKAMPVMRAIADSLKFDAASAYDPRAAASSASAGSNTHGRLIAQIAIALMIVLVAAAIIKRRGWKQ